MKYKVLSNLSRDRNYLPGDIVELVEVEGKHLTDSGVVEPMVKPFGDLSRRTSPAIQFEDGEISSLFSSLQTVTDSVLQKISDADGKIAKLEAERSLLTDSPVSRDDFMAYIRADIERRGEDYKRVLVRWQGKWFENTFSRWEGFQESGKQQPIPYLDGETFSTAMSTQGLFWLFGEQIAARFGEALEALPFPDDAIPVEERRIRIAAIDAEIAGLAAHRDSLAAQLKVVLGEP
ncbi:hypothetical protein [Accumulibacter sp.]|uniref:hypothetical protein n=1 Tax=Accumulibacter sp. TaxID=2053492 RepID=UPI001A48312A|nr:hypothetical protein [Accumulibacter sp.]MBL8374129.1 hypothetical protein [Accumulibacter sp.]